MLFREDLEKREELLSKVASKSAYSKGRRVYEQPCAVRTEYQRDRDRIIHSKAFRRLMHKTQVFLRVDGDHYRTRLTHTLEVSQVARTISRALSLNEDLAEAIALGHDLGHTPFGHNGEAILNDLVPGGFRHNEQSLRVVDLLETTDDRIGLNLTYEVRDGIRNHSGSTLPCTPEGSVVRLSDRIAYINHDIDDALRSGVLRQEDLPERAVEKFGTRHSQRLNTMITNAIRFSDGKSVISMDEEHMECMNELRKFMFKNVYLSSEVKSKSDLMLVEKVITTLYNYYVSDPKRLPSDEQKNLSKDGPEIVAKDYIAGMTERFAVKLYESIENKS